MYSLNKVNKVH